MQAEKKGLWQVHAAVLLMGFAGLFPKWIPLPAPVLTWGRVFSSALILALVLAVQRQRFFPKSRKDCLWLCAAGAVLALHWSTFQGSIQVSTVAVGTLTFSTFPIFVTFLEPVLFHERLRPSSVVTAAVMFCGVLLIVPRFELGDRMVQGVLLGMVGSLTYAVLSLINRRMGRTCSGTQTAFCEQAVAAVLLLPVLIFDRPQVTAQEVGLILLFGSVFTALAHTLFIVGIRFVRVQTAGVISSLESVYGIILAALLLGEWPTSREVMGAVIILGAAVASTLLAARPHKHPAQSADS
jgi:drug/metabolite transporter (DMT)-like permease